MKGDTQTCIINICNTRFAIAKKTFKTIVLNTQKCIIPASGVASQFGPLLVPSQVKCRGFPG